MVPPLMVSVPVPMVYLFSDRFNCPPLRVTPLKLLVAVEVPPLPICTVPAFTVNTPVVVLLAERVSELVPFFVKLPVPAMMALLV